MSDEGGVDTGMVVAEDKQMDKREVNWEKVDC